MRPQATTRNLYVFFRDLITLTKPRINALVLVTTFVGMWMAASEFPTWFLVISTLSGTGLTVAAASVFNCYQEIETDARMSRTSNRPLPDGRITPKTALRYGTILGIVGLVILYLAVNGLSTILAAVALCTYTPIYTMLKPITSLSTIVGAIPGALPPVIGWVAVTGSVSMEAILLFLIMFLWQPPHFLALAIFRKHEYEQAQLAMLPVEESVEVALRQIVVYTAALLPLSLMPYSLDMAGMIYLLAALLSGAIFLLLALAGFYVTTEKRTSWAKFLFFYSILYLTVLFGLLLVNPSS